MKILVGVCGIGYGHSVRQSLVVDALLARGARVAMFCSGRSLGFFRARYGGRLPVLEVGTPWIAAGSEGIDWGASEARNRALRAAHARLSVRAWAAARDELGGDPDVCVSDYESETARFASARGVPLVTVDQQSRYLGWQTRPVGARTREEERSRLSLFFPEAEARFALSFFALPSDVPPDRRYPVHVCPAPIRPAIWSRRTTTPRRAALARRAVVYLSPYGPTGQDPEALVAALGGTPQIDYGVYDGLRERVGPASPNVTFRPLDSDRFARALAEADFVVGTAGHTLLSEAVALELPVYAVPLGTYDQHYCGRVIQSIGAGVSRDAITPEALAAFVSNLERHREAFADPTLQVGPEVAAPVLDRIEQLARRPRRPDPSPPQRASSSLDRLYLPDLTPPAARAEPESPSYETAVIKPTLACANRCTACEPRARRWWGSGGRTLTVPEWAATFDELAALGFRRVTISGGEPTTYGPLAALVRAVRERGLEALLNTSGFGLDASRMAELVDAGLQGIVFSLDSPWADVHDELRGRPGSWRRCLAAIRAAREHRGALWFSIRSVLTSRTLGDLARIIQLAAELGASSLKLSYLEWAEPGHPLLPSAEALARLSEDVIPAALEALSTLSPSVNGFRATGCRATGEAVLKGLLFPEAVASLESYASGVYQPAPERAPVCHIPRSLIILYGDGRLLPCNACEYSREALPGDFRVQGLAAMLAAPAMRAAREAPPAERCRRCPMPLHVALPLNGTLA